MKENKLPQEFDGGHSQLRTSNFLGLLESYWSIDLADLRAL
jgi:hypothetical protein